MALKKSSAMTTDPWSVTNRTISYADHTCIEPKNIVMLIEFFNMGDTGIFVWLLEEKIVWQILKKDIFFAHWKCVS